MKYRIADVTIYGKVFIPVDDIEPRMEEEKMDEDTAIRDLASDVIFEIDHPLHDFKMKDYSIDKIRPE